MSDAHFRDVLLIWVLRRLDLGEARREMEQAYGELFESGKLDEMTRDALTVYMLDILDRHEIPHPIRSQEDFAMMRYTPF